ncbi:MAG TPA: hypothetical protein VK447_02730 [Myxococcaceae bacterium]|nr:hypothetical protein [Myxococcaceae bacterium]
MKARSSKSAVLAAVAWGVALLATGCPARDYCAESPLCEDNRAINCEPICQVGPCSNGPKFRECGASATCRIVPGDPSSARFFRGRAVCVLPQTDVCDPATAPAPTCDGLGNITGCSAYRRVIVASCSQAGLFFAQPACCASGADGGVPDGGQGGGDGGNPGGQDGGT